MEKLWEKRRFSTVWFTFSVHKRAQQIEFRFEDAPFLPKAEKTMEQILSFFMNKSVVSSQSTACGKYFEEKATLLAKGFGEPNHIFTSANPQRAGV